MPAVEVSDVTTLARVPAPGPDVTERTVRSVTDAPSGFEGEGFPVRRAFAGIELADLDPFIHMDQMGPVVYGPGEAKGTAWHPHRGFETVTYVIDGSLEHQDGNGRGGTITSGGTQWMTAGAGVLHVERPPEALVNDGGPFHGLQFWVNLPRSRKFSEPRYQDLPGDDSVVLATEDGGALVRLIAGSIGETEGPASTNTPLAVLHAIVNPGSQLRLPWRADFNALVYALSGAGTVGPDSRNLVSGQLAVLDAGDLITISATDGLDVMVLGGVPIREPIVWGWAVRAQQPRRGAQGVRRLRGRTLRPYPRRRGATGGDRAQAPGAARGGGGRDRAPDADPVDGAQGAAQKGPCRSPSRSVRRRFSE
ncbi:MAG TPA: pirin family protein [Pseudonocardia sp.]|nr:pirin family protein [Pseudonocardia sp.]